MTHKEPHVSADRPRHEHVLFPLVLTLFTGALAPAAPPPSSSSPFPSPPLLPLERVEILLLLFTGATHTMAEVSDVNKWSPYDLR